MSEAVINGIFPTPIYMSKLDRKLTLDALCGNKYLPEKLISSYKYICGMRIYIKLRELHNKKKREKKLKLKEEKE